MGKSKRLFFVFLTVLLLCSFVFSAYADGNLPEISRTDGTITVYLRDGQGEPVEGGKLAIYQIAAAKQVNADCFFVLNDEFADSGIVLEDYYKPREGSDILSIVTTEEMIAKLVKSAEKAEGITVNVAKNGEAIFENLPMGLYLVIQVEAAQNYTTLNPFLVSLPTFDETRNVWVYNVDASPKTGTVTEIPTEPTPPTTQPSRDPEIPYTGQNWLPVWILAAGGVVVFFMGVFTVRKRSHDAA